MHERDGSSVALEWFRVVERFIIIVCVPLLVWSVGTIVKHETDLATIRASRVTARDVYELTLQVNEAINVLRSTVNLIESENKEIRRRIDALENNRD